MGLVVFAVMGLYLLLSVAVVIGTVRYARKNGRRAWLWGSSVALVMYLIPFWDWIPTVAMHRYYCAAEAGFWVYKTPEQWMKENPGVMETLHEKRQPIHRMPYGYKQVLDERFSIETHRTTPLPLITTTVDEQILVDMVTGEILAKSRVISSGAGNMATEGGFKFWLNQKPCGINGLETLTTEIQKLRAQK
jgi:hypothetical protein